MFQDAVSPTGPEPRGIDELWARMASKGTEPMGGVSEGDGRLTLDRTIERARPVSESV
jgi:hypothetical protein